jgi:hypothetical protein
MFEAACDPSMYQIQEKSFDFPDMSHELCPQCEADYMRKHGFYKRFLVTVGFEGIILVRRYYCRECRRTVSLLPSFCHPMRTYGTHVIIGLLTMFYIKMVVTVAAAEYKLESGVECSRQLLLHYRQRIERNLNSLIMAITDIRAMQAPPVTEKEDKKEKVRQFLSCILNPQDDSLAIFERTRTTYLTKKPI